MELMKESIEAIIDNIHEAEEYLVAEDIDDFLDIIVSANNVFVTGAGRSGLAAKAFAMRLMHLGLSAYVVGETIRGLHSSYFWFRRNQHHHFCGQDLQKQGSKGSRSHIIP